MPSYSGNENDSGRDSWGNLVGMNYGIPNGTSNDNYNKINSWPLDYAPTGHYNYSSDTSGYIRMRMTSGTWWSSSIPRSYTSKGYAALVNRSTKGIYYGSSTSRGQGSAIRCVVRS